MRIHEITGRFTEYRTGSTVNVDFRIYRDPASGQVTYSQSGQPNSILGTTLDLVSDLAHTARPYIAAPARPDRAGEADLTKQAVATLAAYFKVSEDVIEQAAADAQLTVEG